MIENYFGYIGPWRYHLLKERRQIKPGGASEELEKIFQKHMYRDHDSYSHENEDHIHSI